MKPWVHVVIVLVGGAFFYALVGAWSDSLGNFSPRWYHEPIVFPLRVALWFSDNPHDLNAPVANVVWTLECVVAGLLVDLLALTGVRYFRSRKPDEEPA